MLLNYKLYLLLITHQMILLNWSKALSSIYGPTRQAELNKQQWDFLKQYTRTVTGEWSLYIKTYVTDVFAES